VPKAKGPQSGTDLRFLNPQPDTSLHCGVTTNTKLVHHTVCLFMSQLLLVLIASTHRQMARLTTLKS